MNENGSSECPTMAKYEKIRSTDSLYFFSLTVLDFRIEAQNDRSGISKEAKIKSRLASNLFLTGFYLSFVGSMFFMLLSYYTS